MTAVSVALGGGATADPFDPPPPLLPEFVPTPSDWAPQFPYPYDESRKDVTDADINAEREMCQWFNAQYQDLKRQMDKFGFNLLDANNDWTVGTIQAQADNVAANIEQTVRFLTPRTQALTLSKNFAGDLYFAIYQGEPFYRLWQELSNVGVGIRARNTAWVYGPSQQRVKRWGSQIERSHVCNGA
ncbi:hypothetical protein A5742_04915 [Mycolicibacterium fortuitum]|uniref:Uncharacterized protein n=1 Tax=Mycolicibacterium fortuitum TaxID=1766 RepID=A0ABD6QI28_MYCFO|nr:hypothetical protein A5742_04915 [Mycolicibacterium fortuitum]